jgi:hypothetical protein
MIEELRRKARKFSADNPEQGAVTVPAESCNRSPVILFIGGGMGAGKSTVVKDILSRYGQSTLSNFIKSITLVGAYVSQNRPALPRPRGSFAKCIRFVTS